MVLNELFRVGPCAVLLRPSHTLEGEAARERERTATRIIGRMVVGPVEQPVAVQSEQATPDGCLVRFVGCGVDKPYEIFDCEAVKFREGFKNAFF